MCLAVNCVLRTKARTVRNSTDAFSQTVDLKVVEGNYYVGVSSAFTYEESPRLSAKETRPVDSGVEWQCCGVQPSQQWRRDNGSQQKYEDWLAGLVGNERERVVGSRTGQYPRLSSCCWG